MAGLDLTGKVNHKDEFAWGTAQLYFFIMDFLTACKLQLARLAPPSASAQFHFSAQLQCETM